MFRRPPAGGPIRGFAVAAFAALGLSGCTDAAGYDLDYILARPAFVATMRTTVAYDAQSMPRLPAEGTVPVSSPLGEMLPHFTAAALDSVGDVLFNPLPVTPEILARGATVYANQCFSCHGAEGEGNGPVVGGGRFPLGPPVNSGLAAARADGYLYGVIRVGRGLMPGYGERISHNDRWALVHYLRQLQGSPAAAPVASAAPAPSPDVLEPGTGQ